MSKRNVFMRNERVKASVKSTNGFFEPGLSENFIRPKNSETDESTEPVMFMAAPRMAKTSLARNFESNEEVKAFLEQPDFECNEIDVKTSTKSNFFTLNNNWLNLVKYLRNLKDAVRWLWEHIQIEALVDAVLEKLQKQKNLVSIPATLPTYSDMSYTDPNTGKHYTISRPASHCIQITRNESEVWETEALIVCVKDVNYTSVNVSVTTTKNCIRIDFLDGQVEESVLQSNYYVYFI